MKSILAALLGFAIGTANASAAWVQWTFASGGNGHFYQAVHAPDGIDWFTAKAQAEAMGGHLVTITSAEENTFVHGLISSSPEFWINGGADTRGPWIGGFQPPDAAEPGGGWSWVTGEAFSYANWSGSEPNDNPVGEDTIHFLGSGNNNYAATWNDLVWDGGFDVLPRGFIMEIPEPSTAAIVSILGTTLIFQRRERKQGGVEKI